MRRFSCIIKETKNQILEEELANYDAVEIEVVPDASLIPDDATEDDILNHFTKIKLSPRLIDKDNVPQTAEIFTDNCLKFYTKYEQWLESGDKIAQKVVQGWLTLYQKMFIVR